MITTQARRYWTNFTTLQLPQAMKKQEIFKNEQGFV